jgi:hypothetical protein
MGIDTQAVIVVGLPDDELDIERNNWGGYDDKDILQMIPSYFDATEGIIGVEVLASPDYGYSVFDVELLVEHIRVAKATFKLLTGEEGKVYLSPKVW